MPKTYDCPCCGGQGLVHGESTEAEPLECVECDATGKVTKQHREGLLAWRHRCRLRRPRDAEVVEDTRQGPERSSSRAGRRRSQPAGADQT